MRLQIRRATQNKKAEADDISSRVIPELLAGTRTVRN